MSTPEALVRAVPLCLYYALMLILFVGFLFHRSDGHASWYPYSFPYTLFLALLASGFGLPILLARLGRKHGRRRLVMSLLPLCILAVLAYCTGALVYYYTTTHYFDPYLQIPPPILTDADLEKRPGEFRILALGGSTTGNYNLPDEQKYPSVLEELLQASNPDLEVKVFNAGANWYSSKHSLINYVTQMRDWRADAVVVMHGINDLQRSFSDTQYAHGPYNSLYSHYYGSAINGARPPTFEQHLLRTKLAPLRLAWFSQIRRNEVDVPLDRFYSLDAFDRNLQTLFAYVRADGATPVLVSQPNLFKTEMSPEERSVLFFAHNTCKQRIGTFRYQYPSPGSMGSALAAFNRRGQSLAEEQSLLFVDTAAVVPKDLTHFIDDVHFTAPAARLVAEAVARAIERAGLLETERSAASPDEPTAQTSTR